MVKFVFAYHGGSQSMSPEDGRAHMDKWMAWMSGLGRAVVDRGLPVGTSMTVAAHGVAEGGGPNPLAGYTVVEAHDLAAALDMAKRCPHIDIGGTIEVAPALDMPM